MTYLILIPLLPLLAFALIAPLTKLWKRKSAFIATIAIIASSVFSLMLFFEAVKKGGPIKDQDGSFWTANHHPVTFNWSLPNWLPLGGTDSVDLSFSADGFTLMMLLVVTLVSVCVHIYSFGYMDYAGKYYQHEEKNLPRYYGYLSIFTAAMLIMVLANNLILAFIGWELMGLASYLLIGFWFDKESAAVAAKKAFLTTKVGDLSLFLGVLTLYGVTGTFDIPKILEFASTHDTNGIIGVAALLIFGGAMGKSAQFFLHVWLPDAMEGPTPASSLIHAATMVAAGVYLIARLHPIYSGDMASSVVSHIGAFTALFAASIAIARWDIKRVLAYSTISQLGFMVAGLGTGSVAAGIFHLFTHAFFKALLFQAAGSVIHGVHTNDMREMGNLKKYMPKTFMVFLIGTLALSGIPPFSGFFSKDEILLTAYYYGEHGDGWLPYIMLSIAAFFTAFYMFRVVYLTFFGKYRGHGHPHESPSVMTGPMIFLASMCLIPSFVGVPGKHGSWAALFIDPHPHHGLNLQVALTSTALAVVAILLAKKMFLSKSNMPKIELGFFEEKNPVLWKALSKRLYVDEVLQWSFVKPGAYLAEQIAWFDKNVIDGIVNRVAGFGDRMSSASAFIDKYIIDGIVNLFGSLTKAGHKLVKMYQTGFISGYLFMILIMLALILLTQGYWVS